VARRKVCFDEAPPAAVCEIASITIIAIAMATRLSSCTHGDANSWLPALHSKHSLLPTDRKVPEKLEKKQKKKWKKIRDRKRKNRNEQKKSE